MHSKGMGQVICCLVTKSCVTLFATPWNVASPGFSLHGIFQTRILSCPFLLQGIFPNQRLNPGFLHWQADSLPLSHLGSP